LFYLNIVLIIQQTSFY